MLGKLIKHEFKATAKLLLPLLAAVLALMGGFQVIFLVVKLLTGRNDSHPLVAVLFALFAVLAAFALLAMLAVIVIVAVQRFYKNLLGDEGYLMFTLPATPGQQIFSKLLVSLVWSLMGIVVVILGGVLFVWNLPEIANAPAILASFRSETGMSIWLAALLLALFMVLAFSNTYLHFYLCMAIGGQWPQNRLLASAAAYLILNTLLQFVMMFGMITAALAFHFADMSFFRGFQSLAEQSPALFIYSMLGIGAGLMIFLDVIYYLTTRWLLSRNLRHL